jgi:FkbM family methyltransferase
VRKIGVWARSLLEPRARLLPGVGERLGRHPRVLVSILLAVRRLPTQRLRAFGYDNLSRPLIRRLGIRTEVPVESGARILVDTGDVIGRRLVVSGLWEPEVTRVFREVLSAGDVCVDVGANIGYFTLLASKLVGPSGRVYAVEPGSAAHAALLANLERNDVVNVVPVRVAAGAREGHADLHDPPPGNLGNASFFEIAVAGGSPVRPTAGVTRVPVLPVPALLEQEDRQRLKLVKIDVEDSRSKFYSDWAAAQHRRLRPSSSGGP